MKGQKESRAIEEKKFFLTLSFQMCNFGVINLVCARILGETGRKKVLWRLTDKQMGNRVRDEKFNM